LTTHLAGRIDHRCADFGDRLAPDSPPWVVSMIAAVPQTIAVALRIHYLK
jgi:hypothetical protein